MNCNEKAIEAILHAWLGDRDLTIFCGRWHDGGVMELLPGGRVELSGPRYDGPFAGIRELRLADEGHHVHLDLGKLARACYLVLPNVCYGFRPSFELRLAGADEDPRLSFGLGLGIRHPYLADRLRVEPAQRFFARVAEHLHHYPDVVSFDCTAGPGEGTLAFDRDVVEQVLERCAADGAPDVVLGRMRDALAAGRSSMAGA